jgi:hypothetical protein
MKRITLFAALALVFGIAGSPSAHASQWQGCGVVPGPVALYELKAKGANCRGARRVGKKWTRRVVKGKCSYMNCTSFGYRCKVRNLKQTPYYTSYRVFCKKRVQRITWVISLD